MIVNDGGPAFPVFVSDVNESVSSGMSIRDYIAIAVIQGQHAGNMEGWSIDQSVSYAYNVADAMLEERKKVVVTW
jgi:hypothetical protein